MKKDNISNKDQITTTLVSEVLNLKLDPEIRRKLQVVSEQVNKAPPDLITEMVYHVHELLSSERFGKKNAAKEDLALVFEFTFQHLHLLPQIGESVSLLSGRDTDVVIDNLIIDLKTNTVTFSLGFGLCDLEKVFVTIAEGHTQLFSNRYLEDNYTTECLACLALSYN